MPTGDRNTQIDKLALVDYWLSKLMFDLQMPITAEKWRADRLAVLDQYPLRPEIRAAVLSDDIALLSRHVNAYLLRFYFAICGMGDAEFMSRLHAIRLQKEEPYG